MRSLKHSKAAVGQSDIRTRIRAMGFGMHAGAQLDGFIDKFTPEVAALTRALIDKMKARVPGATIMVYDNYNALAIGFGPTDRAGQAVF